MYSFILSILYCLLQIIETITLFDEYWYFRCCRRSRSAKITISTRPINIIESISVFDCRSTNVWSSSNIDLGSKNSTLNLIYIHCSFYFFRFHVFFSYRIVFINNNNNSILDHVKYIWESRGSTWSMAGHRSFPSISCFSRNALRLSFLVFVQIRPCEEYSEELSYCRSRNFIRSFRYVCNNILRFNTWNPLRLVWSFESTLCLRW